MGLIVLQKINTLLRDEGRRKWKRSKMGQCQYKSDQFNWNSNI